MAAACVDSSIVALKWYDKNGGTDAVKNGTISTGFVRVVENDKDLADDKKGLYIISTLKQISQSFPKGTPHIDSSVIGVKVIFNDNKRTTHDGMVMAVDDEFDLALTHVRLTDAQLSTKPFVCIHPPLLTLNPPCKQQPIYTIHHSIMNNLITGAPDILLLFQQTEGWIMEPNYDDRGRIHYYLPLIVPSSSGAPILDPHTKRVLCVAQEVVLGTSCEGKRQESRLVAIPVSYIEQFFRRLGMICPP